MNNQFKQLSKNKKYILIFMIVLFVIGIIAFSLFREKANVLVEENQLNKNIIFSSYEERNGTVIKLFSDNGCSKFYDLENNEIYTTSLSVDYFKIVDENSIIFVSSHLNEDINEWISDVVYVNLQSKEEKVLNTGTELFIESSEGLIYIVNSKNGEVLFGAHDDLKKFSLNTSISKIVNSRDKIFAINHTVINDVVRSTIYCVTDNTIDNIICPGKVQSISVDYSNDNVIYYSSLNLNNSINSSDSSNVVVFKKYLLDLSASPSEPEMITTLNSNIISIKDKYISLDKEDNALYLLTSKYTKLKRISYLYENNLTSLIKVSTDGENLYFIDNNGQLKKI